MLSLVFPRGFQLAPNPPPLIVPHQAPQSMRFSSLNTSVGCDVLLWRIFLSQGSNPGLLNADRLFTTKPPGKALIHHWPTVGIFFFMCVKPGNVLLSLACFKNNFADVEFLVYGLFLSALWMYHLNAFWPPWFVMWNQLLISCKIPFTQVILFTAFSVLLVSFNSLLMIYIILGSYSLLIELLRYVNEFFKTKTSTFFIIPWLVV